MGETHPSVKGKHNVKRNVEREGKRKAMANLRRWRVFGALSKVLVNGFFIGAWQHPASSVTSLMGPMRRLFSLDSPLPPILLPVCGALLSLAIARSPAAAAAQSIQPPVKTYTFFISMKDGYGLSNCLTTASACGRIVADSWCSAKGYGKARAWGNSSDMTASIGGKPQRAPAHSIAVTCNE